MKNRIISLFEWITFIPNAPFIFLLATYVVCFKIGFPDALSYLKDNDDYADSQVADYCKYLYPTWLTILVAVVFYLFVINYFI